MHSACVSSQRPQIGRSRPPGVAFVRYGAEGTRGLGDRPAEIGFEMVDKRWRRPHRSSPRGGSRLGWAFQET